MNEQISRAEAAVKALEEKSVRRPRCVLGHFRRCVPAGNVVPLKRRKRRAKLNNHTTWTSFDLVKPAIWGFFPKRPRGTPAIPPLFRRQAGSEAEDDTVFSLPLGAWLPASATAPPIGAVELLQIAGDALLDLCQTSLHVRAREVLVTVVHREQDRLGAAVTGCGEEFERAVAGGARPSFRRAAVVTYRRRGEGVSAMAA
jgi:hypothetical protein